MIYLIVPPFPYSWFRQAEGIFLEGGIFKEKMGFHHTPSAILTVGEYKISALLAEYRKTKFILYYRVLPYDYCLVVKKGTYKNLFLQTKFVSCTPSHTSVFDQVDMRMYTTEELAG